MCISRCGREVTARGFVALAMIRHVSLSMYGKHDGMVSMPLLASDAHSSEAIEEVDDISRHHLEKTRGFDSRLVKRVYGNGGFVVA